LSLGFTLVTVFTKAQVTVTALAEPGQCTVTVLIRVVFDKKTV
jgi:hypothetical protein